ncbi:MAG: nucleotidyltransferase domain-containing protein [Chloroflexi bacterium]|nr:nucleotidyltransferase domain-containing protein [Chloroflexota bacterium]
MKENRLKYLTAKERRALREYVERLRAEFGADIQRVFLYGSKVRGDFDAESDIDVCIVVRNLDAQKRRALTALGIDIDLKHNVLLGDFIVDEARFELMSKYREPLYQALMTEGIELWMTKSKPSSRKKWNAPTMTSVSRKRSKPKAGIAKPLAAHTMPSLRQQAQRSSPRASRAKNTRA